MIEEQKVLLILLIKKNASLLSFKRMGYKYEDLLGFISNLAQEGYVENIQGKLNITLKGEELLKHNSGYAKVGSNAWITPQNDAKISKLDENSIYLPEKSALIHLD